MVCSNIPYKGQRQKRECWPPKSTVNLQIYECLLRKREKKVKRRKIKERKETGVTGSSSLIQISYIFVAYPYSSISISLCEQL